MSEPMSFQKKSRRERYIVRDDVVGEGGFEPPKALLTDLQSAPFGHSGIPPYALLVKLGWSW